VLLSYTLTFECGTVQLETFELLQRRCSGARHRREPSAVSPLCTRTATASEPDVLITHLAIERACDYDLIGRPVVHDGLVRLQAPRHGHVECVSHVLLHVSPHEPRATGVTRLGPVLGIHSCISTLRCRATAVSSERLYV